MPTPSPALAVTLGIIAALGVIIGALITGRYQHKIKMAELASQEREQIRVAELKKQELDLKKQEFDAKQDDTVHKDLKEAYDRLKAEVQQLNEKVATLIQHKDGQERAERERDQIKAEAEDEKRRTDNAFRDLRQDHQKALATKDSKIEELTILLNMANRALDEQHIVHKERQFQQDRERQQEEP